MARRMRGMGVVYPRGDVWWIKYSVRGKRVRESSQDLARGIRGTEPDAIRLLKTRIGEIASGRYIGPEAEKVMFEKLASLLIDDYNLNNQVSVKRVELALSHLREVFGKDRALDITSDRLVTYVNTRKAEGAALASIGIEISALRRGFNLAIAAGILPIKPVFPKLRIRNTRKGFFEAAEFRAVYAKLDEDIRPLAEFLYLIGWRTGEAKGLEWRQVDLEAGVFRIEDSKNGEARTVPYYALPELAAIIKSQRERADIVQRATDRIVTHVFFWSQGRMKDGKPVNRGGRVAGMPIRVFHKPWEAACKAAGIVRLAHDFRRTAARDLSRAGLPEGVIMELCGWKTASVFRRYRIVNESDLAEGLAKRSQLGGVLQKRKGTERAQSGQKRGTERGPLREIK